MVSSNRYRVWCLSWDDEEEDGSDVVAYDVMRDDYPRERYGTLYVPNTVLHDAASAATAYAEYAHSRRDGYECTWPLIFRVKNSDGSFQDFEIDREYVPEFTATLIQLAPAVHILWSGHALCDHARLRRVPKDWPQGHSWISLKDVADGATAPADQARCEACWKKAPGLIAGLQQIGAKQP